MKLHPRRRLLAWLLSIAMLLSMMPASPVAHADEVDTVYGRTKLPEMEPGYLVNSLHSGTPNPQGALPAGITVTAPEPLADTSEYLDVEGAAAVLRAGMVAHQSEVTIRVCSTNSNSQDVAYDVFYTALEHTGTPTEGDYLGWQWDGLSYSRSGSSSNDTYYYDLRYYVEYYTTLAQEDEMDAAFQVLMDTLDLYDADDYTKVKGIYDWICTNVTYDYDTLNDSTYGLKYTAYAALVNRTAVCQGYALLLYRAALTLGIDCRLIASVNHGYNIVKLGDLYYYLDATWDAGLTPDNYNYFLQNEENFEDCESHIRVDCSDYYGEDYDYTSDAFYARYPMSPTPYSPASPDPVDPPSGHTCSYNNGFCTTCDGYQPAVLNSQGMYEISNGGQLYWFAELVNGGESEVDGQLMQDITVNQNVLASDGTLNGDGSAFREWTPIGNSPYTYQGTFDGNTNTIRGLYFNDSTADYVGLFGDVSDAEVKSVTVADSYFCGYRYVGSIVGNIFCNESQVTISNCHNESTVIGENYVGGVAGYVQVTKGLGTVTGCQNRGAVNGESYTGGIAGILWSIDNSQFFVLGCQNHGRITGQDNTGGLAGYATGKMEITGCHNEGSISGDGSVGGILGHVQENPVITDCDNEGTINGTGSVGGVVGYSFVKVTVTNCHNLSTVNGTSNAIGGVVGHADDEVAITNCSNQASVAGNSHVGGIAGYAYNDITVTDCHNEGTAKGAGTSIGGVVGHADLETTITNCGNQTSVTGVSYVGGVVGRAGANTTVTQCYNDGAVSGDDNIGGIAGLAGDNVTISNSRNTGDISGTSFYAGGVVGYNCPVSAGTLKVANCFSTGTISGTHNVGSVVGSNYHAAPGTITVTNCYYLDKVGDASNPGGIDGTDVPGSAEARTAEAFASGEVAYLLQCDQTEQVWGQKIGEETYPVFSADKVYKNQTGGCNAESYVFSYANAPADPVVTHDWQAATCDDPETCADCGQTRGSSHGHSTGEEGDLVATCEHPAYCHVCSSYYGETNPDNHTSTEFRMENNEDGITHSLYFACCDVLYGTEAHSGTPATCSSRAWCNGCNSYYGETNPSNHANNTNTQLTPVEGGHGVVCSACENPISVEAHSTGADGDLVATCEHPAYCHVCSSYYGETNPENHADNTNTQLTAVEGGHGIVCSACENPISVEAHYGGTATCAHGAYCSVCQHEYTSPDLTNHDTTVAYVNGFCPYCDAYEPCGGKGSMMDPYTIGNGGQLYWFAAVVNSGYRGTPQNAEARGKLIADITVNQNVLVNGELNSNTSSFRPWTPIGRRNCYNGVFDGQEHTISGLYLVDYDNQFTPTFCGLFGWSGEESILRNITVSDSYFSAFGAVGTIVGQTGGEVSACISYARIVSTSNGGGIAGQCTYPAVISDCTNFGKISSTGSSVGGIAGNGGGEISNCRNEGDITGASVVGGIVGNSGTVLNCVNAANVSSTGDRVGGIAGNEGVVKDSRNEGNVSGASFVGGIIGYGGTPDNCTNTGDVTGTGDCIGGIVGHGGMCSHLYNEGTVRGVNCVGGIVGRNPGGLIYAYNIGDVIATGDKVGGIVGECEYGFHGEASNTGNVTGNSYVGGIAGTLRANRFSTAYNAGNVTGSLDGECIGGVVGYSSAEIRAVHNAGTVQGGIGVGGIIGGNEGTITDGYYLEGTAGGAVMGQDIPGSAVAKSEEAFASGEVAWLLQNAASGSWGQLIGIDLWPVFSTDHVFRNQLGGCTEESYIYSYSNTSVAPVTTHDWESTGNVCENGGTCRRCGTTVPGTGHSDKAPGDRYATCVSRAFCSVCQSEYGEVNPNNHTSNRHTEGACDATCTEDGYTGDLVCECGVTMVYGEVIPATGHDYVDGECAHCGETDPDVPTEPQPTEPQPTEPEPTEPQPTEPEPTEPEPTEPQPTEPQPTEPQPTEPQPTEPEPTEPQPTEPEPSEPTEPSEPVAEGVIRLAGANQYATGFAVANQLKQTLGVDKFQAAVVAYGQNFPDALTGSYLAAVKNAPILLTEPSQDANVLTYLNQNLVPGGTVYILGGTAAVSQNFEDMANAMGFNAKRLKGAGRYETNLEILKEAGVNRTDEVLIATGKNYADSLSASATGLPMLLVDKELTDSQREFLEGTSKKFVILGGTGAVSTEIADQLSEIGTVTRVKGASRYGTSVAIAQRYFPNASAAVLAYAQGFPDGLCGGPLALSLGAPLILTSNESYQMADDYVVGITSGVVTGGTGRISDDTVREIFDLPSDTPIVKP